MAFEGDLKNLPLADVLQTIHQNSLTGTLTVRDARGERRVAFVQGLIVAFQPAPGEGRPVIDALAKRRLVAKGEAEKARGGFLGKRKTLRLALASRGLLTEEDYTKVVREDLLEGIYELFLETDRTFKFEDGAPDLSQWDPDQVAAELKLPAPGIVMEGARRTDEWGRIRRAIGSFQEVLVRDGDAEEKDDDVVRELFTLADGTRDLGSILEQLPVPRFRGCEAVAQLVAARRLRPASVNEYLGLGQKAEDRGAFDEAARLYERGLATERGNLALRQKRANALERANRRSEAADERKLIAVALAEHGKRQDAAAELARAADLAPRDPVPLERRLQLALEVDDKDVARVVTARLAALYEDLGLGDKARDALRAQLARNAEDDELREKLAELLHRQGDVKGAAREWNELASHAVRKEQLALAAVRYRKALEVDPGDEGARALLADIESGEIVARRIRRQKRIRLAVGSLFLVVLGAWLGRETEALRDLQRHHSQTGYSQIADGTPEGAFGALQDSLTIRDSYPYTLAARHVDELSETFVELFARAHERARASSVLKPRSTKVKIAPDMVTLGRLGTILDAAQGSASLEQLVDAGDTALAQGDYARAAVSFDRALARIGDAEAVLAQASDAARNTDDLKRYVDRIDRCLARARVGRVKALPLPPRSRAKLAELVDKTLPALAAPEKKP